MALEEEFGIEIQDEEAEKITTIQQAIDFIEKNKQKEKVSLMPDSSRRRVVVTGLGIVSPVGNTIPVAWEAILQGKSGVGKITAFDPSPLPTKIAAQVKGLILP